MTFTTEEEVSGGRPRPASVIGEPDHRTGSRGPRGSDERGAGVELFFPSHQDDEVRAGQVVRTTDTEHTTGSHPSQPLRNHEGGGARCAVQYGAASRTWPFILKLFKVK